MLHGSSFSCYDDPYNPAEAILYSIKSPDLPVLFSQAYCASAKTEASYFSFHS